MNRCVKIWNRLALVAFSGAMLFQAGPCTGDDLRAQLGAGVRTTLNGLFAVVSNQLVTETFNLP